MTNRLVDGASHPAQQNTTHAQQPLAGRHTTDATLPLECLARTVKGLLRLLPPQMCKLVSHISGVEGRSVTKKNVSMENMRRNVKKFKQVGHIF